MGSGTVRVLSALFLVRRAAFSFLNTPSYPGIHSRFLPGPEGIVGSPILICIVFLPFTELQGLPD